MTIDMTRVAGKVAFAPPAPGMWELETTHHGLRPLSPFLRDAYKRAFEAGTTELVKRYGLPLAGVRAELVHGRLEQHHIHSRSRRSRHAHPRGPSGRTSPSVIVSE